MTSNAVRVLLAVLAAIVVFSWVQYEKPKTTDAPPLPIAVSRLQTPHSGLFLIAEDRGYFAANGLDATVTTSPTGYQSIQEVLQGKADAAVAAETPIARAIAEGQQIKVLATIFSSQWNSAVVARRDRGIAKAEDLRGKRIGYVFGTATHYMLEALLAFHRIPESSVTLVSYTPDELVQALLTGSVDAASAWTPYIYRMQNRLADRGVTFTPKDFYSEMTNLVVRADYPVRNPEAVQRLLRTLIESRDFARTHPGDAVRIVASASGVDAAALTVPGNPLTYEVSLKQALVLATQNEVGWYFRKGIVKERPYPDVLAAFDPQPLAALDPGSVTITNVTR